MLLRETLTHRVHLAADSGAASGTTEDSRRQEFRVVEVFNGFILVHQPSCQEAHMGDGVDQEFDGLKVGQPGFAEAWAREANADCDTYREAYFSHIHVPKFLGQRTVKVPTGDDGAQESVRMLFFEDKLHRVFAIEYIYRKYATECIRSPYDEDEMLYLREP
jgi:hypothetical protein